MIAYKRKAKHILIAYLAGDKTLHQEIETNAASTSPVNVLARESLGKKRDLEDESQDMPQKRVKTRSMTIFNKASLQVAVKMNSVVAQQSLMIQNQTKFSEDQSLMIQNQTQMMDVVLKSQGMMQTCMDTVAENARLKAQLEETEKRAAMQLEEMQKRMSLLEVSKEDAVEHARTEMKLRSDNELERLRGPEITIGQVVVQVLGHHVSPQDLKEIGKKVYMYFRDHQSAVPERGSRSYNSGTYKRRIYYRCDWNVIAEIVRRHFRLSVA